MNIDQKLTAIRDLIQQDVGNRGLARDPNDNLFTSTLPDFAKACASIAQHSNPLVTIFTGFFIPTGDTFETDGPLGALFLMRAFRQLGIPTAVYSYVSCLLAIGRGAKETGIDSPDPKYAQKFRADRLYGFKDGNCPPHWANSDSHRLAIEHVGRASDGRRYTMRGVEIEASFECPTATTSWHIGSAVSIGIGDGGNEIGMGKIPHETIVKNIPNGDLIHCRVPTDYLIVAGVSNWGAYALAAGVALLRGVELPAELFDPDREREILQVMVDAGPLVDGVTGKQEATVDGLSWDDYIKPLVEIGKIVRG